MDTENLRLAILRRVVAELRDVAENLRAERARIADAPGDTDWPDRIVTDLPGRSSRAGLSSCWRC
ncbi:hypothetical protein [Nocardia aobensis]|uniref:hypothetical protein n=1 Tax=Nocardia aobensis TaxID=257277 RepID=UPI0002EEF31C|nr:hypothetical protein [Nocardia aobensis]